MIVLHISITIIIIKFVNFAGGDKFSGHLLKNKCREWAWNHFQYALCNKQKLQTTVRSQILALKNKSKVRNFLHMVAQVLRAGTGNLEMKQC